MASLRPYAVKVGTAYVPSKATGPSMASLDRGVRYAKRVTKVLRSKALRSSGAQKRSHVVLAG